MPKQRKFRYAPNKGTKRNKQNHFNQQQGEKPFTSKKEKQRDKWYKTQRILRARGELAESRDVIPVRKKSNRGSKSLEIQAKRLAKKDWRFDNKPVRKQE